MAYASIESDIVEEIEEELDEEIEDEIEEEIEDELEDEIEDELEDEIEDELEDEIEDELEDEIEDELEDEIEDELEDEIEDELEDEIEDELEDEIEDELEDEIEDELEDEIEDELEDEIEDELEDEIEDELEDEIEDELEDEIEDELEDEIEDELEDEIEDELEDEIEDELEDEIEDELEDEIEEDVEDEMEDDLEEDLEEELEDELEDELEIELDETFDEELETEVDARLEEQLVEEVEDQVELALDFVRDIEGREALSEEWIILAEPESLKELEQQGYLISETETLDAMGYIIGTIEAPKTFDPLDTRIAGLQLLNSPTVAVDRNVIYRPVSSVDVPSKEPAEAPSAGTAHHSVGMIDSSIETSHEVFNGAQIIEQVFHSERVQPDQDHGTAVASLLTQHLSDLKLYSAAVFASDGQGEVFSTLLSIVKALNWLAGHDVRIVNMSLSGPDSPVLKQAVSRACAQQMVLVTAVGNAGPLAPPSYPSGYDCTIAVTAVDEENDVFYRAGRGPHVDFASRGVKVAHATPRGYGVSTGTSFATPQVAAILAREKETIGRGELIERADDLGEPGKDPVFGYGLLAIDEP